MNLPTLIVKKPSPWGNCSIKDGKFILDLYRKTTDRNQYLLTSSCHPAHVTKNFSFLLAYRNVQIWSKPKTRDLRLSELRNLLLTRDYKPGIVNKAIEKANQFQAKNIECTPLKKIQEEDLFLTSLMTTTCPPSQKCSEGTGGL